MSARAPRLSGPEWVLLGLLALFAVVPHVVIATHVEGGSATGADGLLAADQLQYMSWLRESADHFLIGNRFDIGSGDRVFLHPLALISGLAARSGLSVEFAYLMWKPVAVVALFAAFAVYVRRFVAGPWARAAALVVALFYFSPLVIAGGDEALAVASELMIGGLLWGYLPSVLAVAAMPVFLLGVERVLDDREGGYRRSVLVVCTLGLLASWLHPWQGVVLLATLGGVVAWGRFDRRYLRLAGPAAATAAPLLGYLALGRSDAAWAHAREVSVYAPNFSLGAIAIAALPLVAVAALAYRGRADGVGERALRLWPLAVCAVYVVTPAFPQHAIAGVSLPLAILAVRGARSALPGRRWVFAVAVVAVVAGPVVQARELDEAVGSQFQAHWIRDDEQAALDHLARSEVNGSVLPTPFLGQVIPAETGRAVWVGHQTWTRDYGGRGHLASRLFRGEMDAAEARALVRSTGVAFLASDCRESADLTSVLRGAVMEVRRFGCATVYRVR